MRTVGAGAEKPGNGAAGAGLKKELEELMAENRRLRMENEELEAELLKVVSETMNGDADSETVADPVPETGVKAAKGKG